MLFRSTKTHWGEFPPNPLFLPPAFPRPQIVKWSIIPEAANRGANGLVVEVPEHIASEGAQVAEPEVVVGALGSTPEESGVSKIVAETTIALARTTWENGKAAFIRCPCIWDIPISSASRFHLTTCNTFSPKISSQNGPLGIGGYAPTCGT